MKGLHEEIDVAMSKLRQMKLAKRPKTMVKLKCSDCGYKHEPCKCTAHG